MEIRSAIAKVNKWNRGTVLVGGDYQGTGTTPKSQTTTVDANSVINVDALTNGNGGTAIVWSDGKTIFDGTITAKGGTLSGNGGLIETSGKDTLVVGNSARVNTSALQGEIGTWLLDPTTITVVASGGTDPDVATANLNNGASTINNSVIVAALNGSDVTLAAMDAITVDASIDASIGMTGDLTLNALTTNLNAPIKLRLDKTLSGSATTVNVGAAGLVQNGVDVAAAGATVNLATATYVLGREVEIAKSLTISGNGSANTIIDGNGDVTNDRVFNITNASPVTFNGVTIRNGKVNSLFGGGGIRSAGAVTLTNSTVSGNTAAGSASGGGIYGNGAVMLTNSTVSGNEAAGSGGGIFGNNGAVTLTNSTVSGNTAVKGSGGGIFGIGAVTLINSTVSGNSANLDGGGVYGNNGGTITNSTITNNTATTGNSGGIFREDGTFTISNSIVAGNFSGVTAQDLGSNTGGVFTNGGNNLIGVNNGFEATFATIL